MVVIEATTRRIGKDSATVAQASAEMTAVFYEGFTQAEMERFERDLGRVLANLTSGRPHQGQEE